VLDYDRDSRSQPEFRLGDLISGQNDGKCDAFIVRNVESA